MRNNLNKVLGYFKDSPSALAAIWIAAFGIVSAGTGSAIQSYKDWKIATLEFKKSLVLKALDTNDVYDAQKKLQWLVKIGLLEDGEGKIKRGTNKPEDIPLFPAKKKVVPRKASSNGENNNSVQIIKENDELSRAGTTQVRKAVKKMVNSKKAKRQESE